MSILQTIRGNTPLIIAALKGNFEVTQLLLAKKEIYVNLANNNGLTPLIIANQAGHLEIAQKLRMHKPNINAANKKADADKASTSLTDLEPESVEKVKGQGKKAHCNIL